MNFAWVTTIIQWIKGIVALLGVNGVKDDSHECECKRRNYGTSLMVTDAKGKSTTITSKCNEIIKITGINQSASRVWVGNKVVLTFKILDKNNTPRGVLVKSIVAHRIKVKAFKIVEG